MVNEINKPKDNDNAALGQRLAESNRSLQQMQQEHLHLLQEMEILRQRAADLSLRREQEEQQQEIANEPVDSVHDDVEEAVINENNVASVATQDDGRGNEVLHENSGTPIAVDLEEVANNAHKETSPAPAPTSTTTETTEATHVATVQKKDDAEDTDESAEYIRQKIAEIASLKAQFSRVQHMINTTKMIEEHVASKEAENSATTTNSNAVVEVAKSTPESAAATVRPQTSNISSNSENQQLLTAMLDMFNDFNTDLRGQAESLRAERERIRTLKEEYLKNKRR